MWFPMDSENILVWNVRGVNGKSQCDDMREPIVAERSSIVCLQETMLHVISPFDVMQFLGSGFDYTFLPTAQKQGGILVTWRSEV
jgi:exonuclease III